MKTKQFPLRDILSVTTGRLLTKARGPHDNGISALYALLGWMTGDAPFTHQLPRFIEECEPWLLRWFPELAKVSERLGNLDILCDMARSEGSNQQIQVEQWLATECERCSLRDEYDVPQIPLDDHNRKNPFDELVEMLGTDQDVVIVDL